MSLLFLLAWSLGAEAQLVSGGGVLEIMADQAVLDERVHKAVYRGKVEIRQGEARLFAEEVTVIYGVGDQVKKPILTAIGGVSEIRGSGGIVYENGPDRIRADQCYYLAVTDKLTLIGHVRLEGDEGSVQSDRMVIDLSEGHSVMTADPGQRVHIVLNMEAVEKTQQPRSDSPGATRE